MFGFDVGPTNASAKIKLPNFAQTVLIGLLDGRKKQMKPSHTYVQNRRWYSYGIVVCHTTTNNLHLNRNLIGGSS